MKTSTIQKLKDRAGRYFENNVLYNGRVLEVRTWEPGTLLEIDLHLPGLNMHDWLEVPYIKFKVSDFTYRDYTPSGWDIETSTCTLFVDAGHDGPGSRWAQSLKRDSVIHYLKTGTTRQSPSPLSTVVAMGDESSLGHLLALQQMTLPVSRFSGAILMDKTHGEKLKEYFRTPIEAVERTADEDDQTLSAWVRSRFYIDDNVTFYLTGNESLVSRLRRQLREMGYGSQRVLVKGFWS
jgi:NADPH-dependent ferric siderophore reductase